MHENISIAKKSDLPAILKLQHESFGRVAAMINNHSLPSLTQTLPQLSADFPAYTILKYYLDGQIVGSIRGRLDDEQICHIGVLVVATGLENKGIGRALITAIEAQFSNCKKYALFTSPKTPNTRYLYAQLGYQEVARGDFHGVEMVFMEKTR